jgi:hypothetical protein
MNSGKHRGAPVLVGAGVVLLAKILLALNVNLVGIYFTPIVWTGYILLVDALNARSTGDSLLTTRRREFFAMLAWSLACWLLFEAYNLSLQNWRYVGLPENTLLRVIGYGWSFATIFPAVLETAEYLEGFFRTQENRRARGAALSAERAVPLSLAGAACLLTPLVVPHAVAVRLFALVWVGFFLLLDPVNHLLGGRSVLAEIRGGEYARPRALALAGIICGVLWEFWNYWAHARWVYAVPISFAGPKLFEMPLLGYLGFIPFAFECFAMQEFLLTLFPSLRKGKSARA